MSHPNRARGNSPGRSPRPAEVRQLLQDMMEERQMTHEEFARDQRISRSCLARWLAGGRAPAPLTWEYLCLQQAYPEVERARKLWREGRPF